jgi:hypothetical protein
VQAADCVSECESINGMMACRTAAGDVRGCVMQPVDAAASPLESSESPASSTGATVSSGGYIRAADCVSECESINGMMACRTAAGDVRGCLNQGSTQQQPASSTGATVSSGGYIRAADCVSECESINGMMACRTAVGDVRGCLNQGSTQQQPASSTGATVSSVNNYQKAQDCISECESINGMMACRTQTGDVRGCTAPSQSTAATSATPTDTSAVTMYPAEDCITPCRQLFGRRNAYVCDTASGEVRGCTASQVSTTGGASSGGVSPSSMATYVPAGDCTTDCEELNGYATCRTAGGSIRGCTKVGVASVGAVSQTTEYTPAASCVSQCELRNGLPMCRTASGEILGCVRQASAIAASAPPATTIGDASAMPASSTALRPAADCVTACQEVPNSGMYGCYTADRQLRGCVQNTVTVSSSSSEAQSSGDGDGGTNVGAIVGGVLGAVAGVAILTGTIVYAVRTHRKNRGLTFARFEDDPFATPGMKGDMVTLSNGKTVQLSSPSYSPGKDSGAAPSATSTNGFGSTPVENGLANNSARGNGRMAEP